MASLIPVTLIGLIGTISASDPPNPVDIVAVIDASNAEQFYEAISTVQKFAVIPRSKISVVSSSEQQPLIVKENIELDDQMYKMELSKSTYKTAMERELTLEKLKTITQGHFTNDNGSHKKAQILCILTDQKHISGNTALIQDVRRIKTFLIALGFSTNEFSQQFMDLAADQNHIIDFLTPHDLDQVINKWRQQVSADSHFVCDTDKYNNPTMTNCYSQCVKICRTTKTIYDLCQEKCPFFKNVDVTKYRNLDDTSKGLLLWILPVGAAIIMILLAVVGYKFRSTISRALRKILNSICKKDIGQVHEQNDPLYGQTDTLARQEVGVEVIDDHSDSAKVDNVAEALRRDELVNGGEMHKVNP